MVSIGEDENEVEHEELNNPNGLVGFGLFQDIPHVTLKLMKDIKNVSEQE